MRTTFFHVVSGRSTPRQGEGRSWCGAGPTFLPLALTVAPLLMDFISSESTSILAWAVCFRFVSSGRAYVSIKVEPNTLHFPHSAHNGDPGAPINVLQFGAIWLASWELTQMTATFFDGWQAWCCPQGSLFSCALPVFCMPN